jgi:hypothetical protein
MDGPPATYGSEGISAPALQAGAVKRSAKAAKPSQHAEQFGEKQNRVVLVAF